MNPLSRILVVDDDEVLRLVLTHTLLELGFDQVETARDGQAALLLLREQRFQVVFTDVEMPLMNGLELLQSIRLDLGLWQLPVFVVTSLDDEVTKRRAREFEAAGFINKPYLPEDIAIALRRVLS
jgi:CheY-like chemotaxis protein